MGDVVFDSVGRAVELAERLIGLTQVAGIAVLALIVGVSPAMQAALFPQVLVVTLVAEHDSEPAELLSPNHPTAQEGRKLPKP